MEIQQNVLKYKLHIISALILSLLIASIVYLAPRLVTILAYFWPLFISTGLFLGASIFIGKTSDSDPSADDKASEVLLDYVVGQPSSVQAAAEVVQPTDSFKSEHDNHT